MIFNEKIFTTPVIVAGIVPDYKWENGVKTDIRIGTRVDVVIKLNAFEQFNLGVKINSVDLPLSEGQIKESRENDSPIFVLFENLSIKSYVNERTPKNVSYSATATGFTVVTDNNAPAGTPPAPVTPTPVTPPPAPKAKPKS